MYNVYEIYDLLLFRFVIFRWCLDAEVKDARHKGISLETRKEEKEAVTNEEEKLFWSKGLLIRLWNR